MRDDSKENAVLAGEWHNEHGSKMVLQQDGRFVRGTYHTQIGSASGIYELVGAIDDSQGPCLSVGFVVVWNNAAGNRHSVTSWSGQLLSIDGEELIEATWLLTTVGAADEWRAAHVGHDTFRRSPQPAARARSKPRSHPSLA